MVGTMMCQKTNVKGLTQEIVAIHVPLESSTAQSSIPQLHSISVYFICHSIFSVQHEQLYLLVKRTFRNDLQNIDSNFLGDSI